MPDNAGAAGFGGTLDMDQLVRMPRHHRSWAARLPFGLGRVAYSRDPGHAKFWSENVFASQLTAIHQRKTWRLGELKLVDVYDLGSGLVTNVGMIMLASDYNAPQNCQLLKLANYHATGTGVTAAAATDIALQTAASPTATTAVAGTQTSVITAPLGSTNEVYRTSGTLTYTGNTPVTEWGLFTAATLSATTGSPFTATAASGNQTVTATPYSASSGTVQGEYGLIVVSGTVWAFIKDNGTGTLDIYGWYKTADGTSGTTPGATAAFTLQPVMLDHKVFSVLNFINGDVITWQYSLQAQPGG